MKSEPFPSQSNFPWISWGDGKVKAQQDARIQKQQAEEYIKESRKTVGVFSLCS